MLLLALSMTAGASSRAMAAPARTAGPRPARSLASSTACGDSCADPAPEAAAASDPVPPAAAAAPAPAAPPAGSVYDRLWSVLRPWDDPKNRWVQELSIVGREQFEYEHVESHEGDTDNFANRRTRLGLKAKVLGTVTLHAEADLNLEGDGETYSRLTDGYVRWSPDKRLAVTAGKQSVKFTLDGSISSTQLVTMDRSNLANNFWFPEEYLTGLSVGGEWNRFVYGAGWFSGGDYNSEFGDLSGGSIVLLSGGYDFANMLGVDKALARADFVWQDPNSNTDSTRAEREVVSLNFQGEKGRWGFSSDIDWSNGYRAQSDLVGGELLGTVKFCDTWQGVVRYTGIHGDDNGVRLARYENRIVVGRGDGYHEIYLGLNKYFYGHKLKWQTGIQYAHLADGAADGGHYSGVAFVSGIRIAW